MPLRFRLIAIGFAFGAVVHLAAIVIPGFGAAAGVIAPWWRHALFAFLDGSFGFAALKRPPILIVATSLLLLQQLSTHGLRAWRMAGEGKIDWVSGLVLGFLVISLVLFLQDRRAIRRIPA